MDDGDLGPRLYREEHSAVVEDGDDPVATAVREMLTEPAIDPDYASAWPTGTELLDYSVSGATATVDLSSFVERGLGLRGRRPCSSSSTPSPRTTRP